MTIIRTEAQAVAWLKARLGKAWIVAEDKVPIDVNHHCAGVAARAFLGHRAGYNTANDIAYAVRTKLRKTTAPNGALHLWTDRNAGHIATQSRPGNVICNVRTRPGATTAVLKEVPLSYYSGLRYVGWVHAWEVPGWGPIKLLVPPPVVAPTPRPAPVPTGKVVVLAELKDGAESESAKLVNVALVAEHCLDKSLLRAYWSQAAQSAFRRYRNAKGFTAKENRAAFVLLGSKHGFTVR